MKFKLILAGIMAVLLVSGCIEIQSPLGNENATSAIKSPIIITPIITPIKELYDDPFKYSDRTTIMGKYYIMIKIMGGQETDYLRDEQGYEIILCNCREENRKLYTGSTYKVVGNVVFIGGGEICFSCTELIVKEEK